MTEVKCETVALKLLVNIKNGLLDLLQSEHDDWNVDI